MNTSGGYFASQFDPNTGQGSGPGSVAMGGTDRKNIVSVSLSQVINWTRKDDGLVIHRQKVHSIACIGLVISVEELTTKNIYTIDDQTRGAPIEVQYWKNDDSECLSLWFLMFSLILMICFVYSDEHPIRESTHCFGESIHPSVRSAPIWR